MQTSADHQSRRRQVSHMTDERGETWSPSGMSKVRSRPESLVADSSMHAHTRTEGLQFEDMLNVLNLEREDRE